MRQWARLRCLGLARSSLQADRPRATELAERAAGEHIGLGQSLPHSPRKRPATTMARRRPGLGVLPPTHPSTDGLAVPGALHVGSGMRRLVENEWIGGDDLRCMQTEVHMRGTGTRGRETRLSDGTNTTAITGTCADGRRSTGERRWEGQARSVRHGGRGRAKAAHPGNASGESRRRPPTGRKRALAARQACFVGNASPVGCRARARADEIYF
jgi:hypothetical protein